ALRMRPGSSVRFHSRLNSSSAAVRQMTVYISRLLPPLRQFRPTSVHRVGPDAAQALQSSVDFLRKSPCEQPRNETPQGFVHREIEARSRRADHATDKPTLHQL